MLLLDLPSEILIQIMNEVGSSFFRKNPARLTICKEWFKFALGACFRHLRLDQKTLRRLLSKLLVSSPRHGQMGIRHGKTDIPRHAKPGILPLLLQDSVEILDLALCGFEDWDSLPETDMYRRGAISERAVYDRRPLSTAFWKTQLDKDLTQLASITNKFPKLRALRINAKSERDPYLSEKFVRLNYLTLESVTALLTTLENLAVLEVDLHGNKLMRDAVVSSGTGDEHLCAIIGRLLPTLQRLRLRTQTICTCVLTPVWRHQNHQQQYQHQQHQRTPTLRLNEVTINLSMTDSSTSSPFLPPFSSSPVLNSVSCIPVSGGFARLLPDLESRAKTLTSYMAAPKKVRILSYSCVAGRLQEFDGLTGRTVDVDVDGDGEGGGEGHRGTVWEDDGEGGGDGWL